jgi:hypothetical protein
MRLAGSVDRRIVKVLKIVLADLVAQVSYCLIPEVIQRRIK